MPLFLDPGCDAVLEPLQLPPDLAPDRWDDLDLTPLHGTYGDYLVAKVSNVFPELRKAHLQ